MKIALLGYGKMGKTIAAIAEERGHEVVYRIDLNNAADRSAITNQTVDVVIEFSNPDAAYENLKYCMQNGLKTICGTTGWLQHKPEIEEICLKNKFTPML